MCVRASGSIIGLSMSVDKKTTLISVNQGGVFLMLNNNKKIINIEAGGTWTWSVRGWRRRRWWRWWSIAGGFY